MEKLQIKYRTYTKAQPPRPIRMKVPGWGGSPEKMEDGSELQPWHCLPFTEGSTYGLELVYEYDNECHVVNDNGLVYFEWDFARELYRRLGRYPEAEAALHAAAALKSDDPLTTSNLALTLAHQSRFPEADALCRRALTLDPSLAIVHYRMGLILAEQGQIAAACKCYEQALEIEPGFEDAKRALAALP
jgi:tetratricopeptide (TPR) repeat protein